MVFTQKLDSLSDADKQLIDVACEKLQSSYDDPHHCVAAAIRAKNGKTFACMDLGHFTGSVGAEVATLSKAHDAGERELDTLVAVRFEGPQNEKGIANPCGKCRQVLLDYAPDLKLLMADGDQVRIMTVQESLPLAYVSNETDEEEDE
jgi:cytidine deaminase